MRRAVGFVAMLSVVAIGGYLYTRQLQTVTPVGTAPTTAIDVIAVRNDLLAIANAERRYWATNARYASLDELQTNGDIQVPNRSHYVYSVNAGETSFKIIATYSGPDPKAPKLISVDETMALQTK